MSILTLNFPFNQQNLNSLKNPDEIVIKNLQTSDVSSLLLTHNFFNANTLKFKVNDDDDVTFNLPNEFFNPKTDKEFLIVSIGFRSNKFRHFWRRGGEFFEISVDGEDLSEFVRRFLIESLKGGCRGVSKDIKDHESATTTQIHLTSLQNHLGHSLLMSAVFSNNQTILNHLLSLNQFNVNQKSSEKLTAIDIAWNLGNFEMVFNLLMVNSVYPVNFDKKISSIELRNLADDSELLHRLIVDDNKNNKEEIEKILTKFPNLKHFFIAEKGKSFSAPFRAITEFKAEVYELLASHGVTISFATDPPDEIEEAFGNMTDNNKKNFKKIHEKLAKDVLSKKYLKVLLINSFVGVDDDGNRINQVAEAFGILDEIEDLTFVLQLVAAVKNFKIIFDFHRESTFFVDPRTDSFTKGIAWLNGLIYIGAKQLLDQERKFEVIGTLAHELYHFAMEIVYRNESEPYALGDSERKKEIRKILKECEEKKDEEKIIEWVFGYGSNKLAELIVRIPHIKGFYFRPPDAADFNEKSERLKTLLNTFDSLFKYYKETIEDVKNSIKFAEKLGDNDAEISWSDLTPQLKLKIKNSGFNFQGKEVKLATIIDVDGVDGTEVYRHLKSSDIRRVFSDYETFDISNEIEVNLDVYIERRFILSLKNEQNEIDKILDGEREEEKNNLPRSPKSVIEEVHKNTGIVILSDYAGSGKTTAFMKLVKQLKTEFPSYWVQYVDLKKHFKAYKESEFEEFNLLDKIMSFIAKKVLKLENFDLAIFLHLFKLGNVIFLFDGVDEISPDFNIFIVNFFYKVSSVSKNKQWISTRPECAEALEKKFQTTAFKFHKYTPEERLKFFQETFKNIKNHQEIKNRMKVALECVSLMEKSSDDNDRDVHNPLILRMIAEVSLDHDLTSKLNFYSLFDIFLPKKFNIVANKGDVVVQTYSNMTSSIGLSIQQVHLVYAVRLISVLHYYRIDFCKRKIRWTNEEISRYGILYIESLEHFFFAHRNFAEFLVALFIVVYVYNGEDNPNLKEAEGRLDLIFYCFRYAPEVIRFIESYFELNYEEESELNKSFEDAIEHEDLKFRMTVFLKSPGIIRSITKFFRKSKKILRALWMLDMEENLVILAMREFSGNIEEICQICDEFLGVEVTQEILNPAKKSSFLFLAWNGFTKGNKVPKKPFFDRFMEMSEAHYKVFEKTKNIDKFLALMKDILSSEEEKKGDGKNLLEIKEFYKIHFLDILHKIRKDKELEQVIKKVKEVFKEDMADLLMTKFTCKIYIKEIDNRPRTFLDKLTDIDFEVTQRTILQDATVWTTHNNLEFIKKFIKFLEDHLTGDQITESLSSQFTHYNSHEKRIENYFNCIPHIFQFPDRNLIKFFWGFLERKLSEDQLKKIIRDHPYEPLEMTFAYRNKELFFKFYKIYERFFESDELRKYLTRERRTFVPNLNLPISHYPPLVHTILLETSIDIEEEITEENFALAEKLFETMKSAMTEEEISILENQIFPESRVMLEKIRRRNEEN